ncbi:hypothetical protein WJX72_009485 [[Myrmecia] bisecta]|uniref:Uncharacterized protein n=1 Tax=[Myrmecia] bisecta TaxID=41462 RepID=A0AAW1PMA7_9CHLO
MASGSSASKGHHADKPRRKESTRQRSFQAPTKEASSHARPGDNRLRRDTPFVCTIRFRNELPEVPGDPKLLLAPLHPEQLAKFALSSLESQPKRDLVLEPELGIPISLLDLSRYSVPQEKLPLPSEDAALLEGDGDMAADTGTAAKVVRDRLRGSKAELSWLMRTTYISHEVQERKQPGAQKSASQAPGALQLIEDREAQIAAIEASFEAAKHAPVHHTKPELQPVAILPVLPTFHKPDKYVHITFDSDPTADHEPLAKLQPVERQRVAEQAVMKSYSLKKADGSQDRFVAYMVPVNLTSALAPQQDGEDLTADSMAGVYEWVREYSYDVRTDESHTTYVLRFHDDRVTYFDLNTKLACQKKSKWRGKADEQQFARPSQIILKRLPAEPLPDSPNKRSRAAEDVIGQQQ